MWKPLRLLWLTGVFLIFLAGGAYAQTYYVDVNRGNDANTGTQTAPFFSIQKAADSVAAGDTVIVMPGVYYESVQVKAVGTAEKPILFRAYENEKDKVIITMADKDIREGKTKWTLEDPALNLYSVPFYNDCPRALYNGADMQNYGSLEKLKTFSDGFDPSSEVYTQNSPHGYWFDGQNNKMYVRIAKNSPYGSSDPNENTMWLPVGEETIMGKTNKGSVVSTLNYSENVSAFAVVTEKPAYVVIYGFTFAAPYYNGVYIRGNNVTVSNCWFYGCMTGVSGAARHYYDGDYISDDVTVEFCNYSSWPTFEDAMDIMAQRLEIAKNGGVYGYSYHFWQKKSVYNEHTVAATFGGYENGGFIGHSGHNWKICHNRITNQLDGMSFFATSPYSYYPDGYSSSIQMGIRNNMVMYENRFEKCLDNAMEFEDRINGLEMYRNEFVDCFEPLSWQPLSGTPFPTNLNIHHNLIYASEGFSKKWYELTNKQYRIGAFKLGTSYSYWSTLPWLMAEPYDHVNNTMFFKPRAEEQGMRVYNNTVILGTEGSFINEVGTTGTDADPPNFVFMNNLVQAMVFTKDAERTEHSICREDRGYDFAGNMFLNTQNVPVVSRPEKGFAANGGSIQSVSLESVFTDPARGDYSLKAGSPAIGAGIPIKEEVLSTADAGAVPFGETWKIHYDPHPYGDIDCDGRITLQDVALQASLIGEKRSDAKYTERADMNFDGVIDQADLALLAAEYALFREGGGA